LHLTAASDSREPPTFGDVAPGQQLLDYLRCDRWRPTAAVNTASMNPATGPSRSTNPGEPCLGRRGALQDFWCAIPLLGTPCFCRRRELFGETPRKTRVMNLSGSDDRPEPDGGIPALPGAAGPRNAAARQRLAKALRANLVRRKAQKRERERRKQTGDAAEKTTARDEGSQDGASTKQDKSGLF
jgi:hypothetical protein